MSKTNILLLAICAIAVIGSAGMWYKMKDRFFRPVEKIERWKEQIKDVVPPRRPERRQTNLQDAINSITLEELRKDLYYLSSDELEGRMSGKRGNELAAEFIKNEFEKMGLPTMYDEFQIPRMNIGPKKEMGSNKTRNIYAWIEGNDPVLKNEVFVIGAHMDHIGYGPRMSRSRFGGIHPGADDNASGTVALLEIAEAFSMMKDKVKRTVVFQAYSGEEMGLLGSRHYVDEPLFPRSNPSISSHVAMLNMDMVGWLNKRASYAVFQNGDSSPDIGRYIGELNDKYVFANNITSRASGGSDHVCFYNKRIPVVFLHTGSHPYYHTTDDTPDKINYTGLQSVARYAFELSWRISQNESKPVFDNTKFKAMSYVHDHGHPEVKFGIEDIQRMMMEIENNDN